MKNWTFKPIYKDRSLNKMDYNSQSPNLMNYQTLSLSIIMNFY